MALYKKKPIVVEAIQWDGTMVTLMNICRMGCYPDQDDTCAEDELIIPTLEDGSKSQVKHIATVGDYIVKGIKGEFYPCKPDIFEETYEPVTSLS